MSNTKDGGPAFPSVVTSDSTYVFGMTLRDWFAGQALQVWVAGISGRDFMDDYDGDDQAFAEHQAAVAKAAYGYADTMLAEREKSK